MKIISTVALKPEHRTAILNAAPGADLADRLAHIDPHAGSLERIRDRHLSVLSDAISGEMS